MHIALEFARAFQDAGGVTASVYCDFIRFIAVMFLILAVMFSLHHFLTMEAKASDGFMLRLGTRLVCLSIGLTLFIIFLTL